MIELPDATVSGPASTPDTPTATSELENEPAFLPAYHKGEAIQHVDPEIDRVESEIDRIERRLDDVSRRERRTLRHDLYYRLRYLNDELARLERHYIRDL